jgi:hypothetical protein
MNKKINKLIKEFGISSDIQLKQLADELGLNLIYVGFAENLPADAKNGCYIINLGDFDRGGTHWTCLYIEKPNGFYYDSYAGAPEDKVIQWLEQNGIKNLIWNDYFQMQKLEETLCGIYCIIFLYHMTYNKKKSLMDRFKDFTKNFTDLDGEYSAGSMLN